MLQNPRVFLHCVSFLCLVVCISSSGQSPDEKQYAVELTEITNQLNNKQSWLQKANIKLRENVESVEELDRSINTLTQEKREVLQQIESLETLIKDLELESARFQSEINQIIMEKSWILHAFKQIEASQLLLILHNPDDPSLLDRLEYYHRLLLKEREVGQRQVQANYDRIDANLELMSNNSRLLQDKRAEISQQENLLVRQRFEQSHIADELLRTIKEEELESQKLVADKERLAALLNHIESQVQYTPVQTATGNTSWPVQGTVQHNFGDPRGDGRLKWEGVYFIAQPGTVVEAVRGGRVEFAEWLRGFGMTMVIIHDQNLVSLYGNCDTLLKRQGDLVESGEAIAVVGRSGTQRDVGLYFEVREKNKPINPLTWLEQN